MKLKELQGDELILIGCFDKALGILTIFDYIEVNRIISG